jgi:4-alpha-glucanotransferase
MDKRRRAGILMPISSLPAPYGIGTMGESAYRFVQWLKSAGMKVWQTLPLLPTNYGDSPYQSCDARALNPYFIDFEELRKEGLLEESEYKNVDWAYDERRVEYGKLFLHKANVLKKAFARFDREDEGWRTFLNQGEYADFGVFMALKCRFGHQPWTEWEDYRVYNEKKITEFVQKNRDEVEFWQFTQYIFLKQWNALKAYANGNGIEIMGDMPIYVAYDSVEMWKHGKELFLLDEEGNPELVAGVPPDAFTDEGQLWGNPVYDWEKMKKNGYAWWQNRIDKALTYFDIVRIDHFRGFDRFYAVASDAENAKNGTWMQGPSSELFRGREHCNIVAEDLGVIDDGVRKLMKETGYPGMKVIEFAFDGSPENEHKPTNYTENFVAYTGTHDNQPLRAYIDELTGYYKTAFDGDLQKECEATDVVYEGKTSSEKCRTVIRLLFASKAFLTVVPMQDVLCLGNESRINFPSTVSADNWSYRFTSEEFTEETAAWLRGLAKKYNR